MNIDRGDVPALEGALGLLPTLASPGADRLRGEPRGNALGLPVGIRLDVPAVRRDGDEPVVAAVVFEPLDELAVGLRLDGGVVGCGTREVSVPANSPLVPRRWRPRTPMRTTVSGLSWRTSLDGVHGIVGAAPLNPHLLSARASHLGELLGVSRAMLAVTDEVRLGGQGLLDRRGIGCHGKPPGPITE